METKRKLIAIKELPLEDFDLVCPECWNSIHVAVSGTVEFSKPVVAPLPERQLFYGCCPNCHRDQDDEYPDGHDVEMFSCDPKLTPYILALNRAGYRTQFCCEGHVEICNYTYANSLPYILFNDTVKNMRKIYVTAKHVLKDPQFTGYIGVEIDTAPLMNYDETPTLNHPLKASDIRSGMRIDMRAYSEQVYEDMRESKKKSGGPEYDKKTEAMLVRHRLCQNFQRFLNRFMAELGL